MYFLLDEKDARRLAIPLLGTVGVLAQAKRSGLITSLRPLFDQLRSHGGFRLSDAVYRDALRSAGEN
ncbi:MAG: DUF3368 domain-containing protein [Chloroflexota bacterium]